MHYRFPGDPVQSAILQAVREFLATASRPREVVIRALDGTVLFRRDLGDDVTCDLCNAVLGLEDRIAVAENKLYCVPCLETWITPYLVEAG